MATVAVLAAIAIAVTRHRLFEIDRLISRSLTYSVVVATLAGVYALLVVGLQAVRSPVAASSDLAVAASTLAVAALFGPVVRRVRRVVDRRFDRSAYDAAQITERFGHRLRDRVDLDEVVGTFEDTVGAAVQPCSVSLWLSTENA